MPHVGFSNSVKNVARVMATGLKYVVLLPVYPNISLAAKAYHN